MHKFLILSLICLLPVWTKPVVGKSLEGLYISDRQTTENGYLVIGIEIFQEKGKFFYYAQELRYKKTLGWEEILFVGKITNLSEEIHLVPEGCQIRATKEWGQKFALLRRFDCEHLQFTLIKNQDKAWVLSESLLGTLANIPLVFALEHKAGNPVGVQLSGLSVGREGIWGFHLNGIGEKNPEKTWNPSKGNWEPFKGFGDNKELQFYRWKRTFSN
ncbi:hypothetical protein EHQ46_09910 [Leptospira yanagawae]|uniref:Uncharacterized protein n=1 Tax=Leptospira yanagawae TaxID=293069 RepID=A0ABY2M0Y2_9LEPT|nr:hypothetical protein [Leptospira yanagawae]TGL20802.1 hypothetical protein EHQ46_09910 [Leptospira yanagawae]